ncbi:PhnE/PtxC family ABC transporter permease [Shewanella cyperi]|uniref:PhnE/PtxC family ABC transporter permease n=1 Tax=Shewanella cyperi TaxID=2814292 RepID=UPI001A953C00|nr:ABC transporter permease [Shewanella cyperi]QSX39477.1 ABC transporter permease [Shewanella cyperi]
MNKLLFESSSQPPGSWTFAGRWTRLTLALWLLSALAFLVADTEVIALEPWNELRRMLAGLLAPDFFATEQLLDALWQTVSFALLGVSGGLLLGSGLALVYHHPLIAAACAFVRAIHELFWALLFLQIFGLSPLTGVMALILPYAGTFARVFHDMLCRAPRVTDSTLPAGVDGISRYVFGKVVHVLPEMRAYVRYRFECGLRSSAVLGFIGMPTLGFHLESAFRQGHYPEGMALLLLFVLMIGTITLWCRRWLVPLYLLLAVYTLPPLAQVDGSLLWRFVSQDIWPASVQQWLLAGASLSQVPAALWQTCDWLWRLLQQQALPGIGATLVLALAALGMTHVLVMLLLPWGRKTREPRRWDRVPRALRWLGLLLMRAIPEYVFAFVFMLLLGPSMLPAMLALALHNGGLIAFLTARAVDREGKGLPAGLDGFGYRILPVIYPGFMALLFYRFEVILRETAILGMLGIATLGFYIDSNFAEIRFAGALVLMICTALLNIGVDILARRLLTPGRSLLPERC